MALTTNVARFHKEVFPKVKYDEMLEQYRINIGDYILLNLTKRELGVLERICQKNNIFIEKIPKLLSVKESETLFIKLHDLKKELRDSPNSETKQELEKQIHNIRTKLFEGHLKLLYIVLYKNIPALEQSKYKEDIIQSAYIILLHHIDIYNPHISNISFFREFFWNYATDRIIKKAISIQNNSKNEDYNLILTAKGKLEQLEFLSIEELSKETGLETHRIQELKVLEQILNAEGLEVLFEQEIETPHILDETEEEEVNQSLLKELLMLMLETLPNNLQKEVLIHRYGLNGNEPQKFEHIAANLGISNRQRAQQLNAEAISNLQNTMRSKYLKELVEGYSEISLGQELAISPINEQSTAYETLELFLMKYFKKEELIEFIMLLDAKYRDVLLSHFELNECTNMTNEEKSRKLGISLRKYQELKRKGLHNLRILIKHKYIVNNPNEDINNVLDYLMYNYLYKGRTKVRKSSGR